MVTCPRLLFGNSNSPDHSPAFFLAVVGMRRTYPQRQRSLSGLFKSLKSLACWKALKERIYLPVCVTWLPNSVTPFPVYVVSLPESVPSFP